MYNGFRFTGEEEIEKITNTSFAILEEIGAKIDYPPLEGLMLEKEPHRIRKESGRLRISRELADENFFSASRKEQKSAQRVEACAEIYEGKYLDPGDGLYKPWNQRRLTDYIKLAKALPNVGQASMLGCPIQGCDFRKQPLYEKYYTAKYGLSSKMGGYSVWDTSLCSSLYRIWEILAKEYGKPLAEVFQGGVYVISPLQLGYQEGEHLMWFREKGLRMFIGCLCSLGMTAPVLPAGAIAMQLAELMLASVVSSILYGQPAVHIWSSLSAADLRTMSFCYGRPEQVIMNNAMADIADYYGLKFWGHGGLTDAKTPSFEAGVQKTATALANLMKGQNGYVCAGILSVDEVFSPAQMVLDNELAGYLKRISAGFTVTPEALGMEALKECVFEGVPFPGCMHTVENMGELWKPEIFSAEMLSGWQSHGAAKACEKAGRQALEMIEGLPDPKSCISEECEQKILGIIEEA